MAHVAKYQAGALGNMCGHFARWNGDLTKAATRDNIDPSRTHLNYNLASEHPEGDIAFINKRIESLNLKRAPRKDAVRMCDCVVTLPKEAGNIDYSFFETVYDFLRCRYGDENVVSAWVHMDETTPHMHFAWVPVTEDGRLSAKDVVNRQDLKTLHQDMQEWLNNTELPIPVLLDDDKVAEKQLSYLKQDEYIAAKQKLANMATEEKQLNERLERLRCRAEDKERDIAELDAAIEAETERIKGFDQETKRIGKRLESLGVDQGNKRTKRRPEGIKATAERERSRTASSARQSLFKSAREVFGGLGLRKRVKSLRERTEGLRERVKAAKNRNSWLRIEIIQLKDELHAKWRGSTFDRDIARARSASRSYTRSSPSRGRSR